MASDKLYELAFVYKKTKLWKKLWDNEMFAIKFSDGEIGYVSIMGKGGTYTAIAIYVGDDGFRSFRKIGEDDTELCSFFKGREHLIQQNCLQVAFENKDALRDEELAEARAYARKHGIRFSGKNAYPQFLKICPKQISVEYIIRKEEAYIKEALEMIIEIANQFNKRSAHDFGIKEIDGKSEEVILFKRDNDKIITEMTTLPEEKEEEFPRSDDLDDFTISMLKRIKKKEVFECELVRLLSRFKMSRKSSRFSR